MNHLGVAVGVISAVEAEQQYSSMPGSMSKVLPDAVHLKDHPGKVEATLESTWGIELAAIVAAPDPDDGQVPMEFVVPTADAPSPEELTRVPHRTDRNLQDPGCFACATRCRSPPRTAK